MNTILFRGKRVANGEWVKGNYIYNPRDDEAYIGAYEPPKNPLGKLEWNVYMVLPETIGQFTGLTDKNGTKIFEGDIGWDDQNECYGVVEFSDGNFSYVWENICTDLFEASKASDIDFISNIHDSPELLEGKV